MDNEYYTEVEFTGKGRLKITAPNGDEMCNRITKMEGYDPNCDIEDMKIDDVVLTKMLSVRKCEEIEE